MKYARIAHAAMSPKSMAVPASHSLVKTDGHERLRQA